MKRITLVKRAVAAPTLSVISYGLEIEVISAEDISKEIFVKQRIIKPDNKFEDVFVAVATPAQMQDLDINSPAADSSYFRVNKINIVGSNASFVKDVFETILAEIQLLVDNEEAVTALEEEALYTISAGSIEESLVPVALASASGEYKSISIDTPTGADNLTMFYTTRPIEVKQLISVVTGTGGPSVTWSIRFSANRNASGTEVLPGGITTTSIGLAQINSNFPNSHIPAGSFLWFTSTGVTGNPTALDVTLVFQ